MWCKVWMVDGGIGIRIDNKKKSCHWHPVLTLSPLNITFGQINRYNNNDCQQFFQPVIQNSVSQASSHVTEGNIKRSKGMSFPISTQIQLNAYIRPTHVHTS